MNLSITAIFYGLVGAGVSAATLLSDVTIGRHERWWQAITSLLFWPLYLPLLLRPNPCSSMTDAVSENPFAKQPDELAVMIAQVERELDLAWRSLDGWSDQALWPQHARIGELQSVWRLQAQRIRELDGLLAQPTFVESAIVPTEDAAGDRVAHCEQSRQQNLARLRAIRKQMSQNLLGTLAWVRELVTMIHVAKYTGAPATRAAELVAQLANAVEGLSEVSEWRTEGVDSLSHSLTAEHSSAGLAVAPLRL